MGRDKKKTGVTNGLVCRSSSPSAHQQRVKRISRSTNTGTEQASSALIFNGLPPSLCPCGTGVCTKKNAKVWNTGTVLNYGLVCSSGVCSPTTPPLLKWIAMGVSYSFVMAINRSRSFHTSSSALSCGCGESPV